MLQGLLEQSYLCHFMPQKVNNTVMKCFRGELRIWRYMSRIKIWPKNTEVLFLGHIAQPYISSSSSS